MKFNDKRHYQLGLFIMLAILGIAFLIHFSAKATVVSDPDITGMASGGGGSGTVTSVDVSVPPFLASAGGPITADGTIAITLSGTALPIASGGTGQTTLNAAINGLLPSQTGNSGKFLSTDGSAISWALVSVPTLANNTYFPVRNAADDGNIEAFKVDNSDNIYFGKTGSGHTIFIQGYDSWVTADRNIDFFAQNNQVNFIGAGGSTTNFGFSDGTQAFYFRIRAATSMPSDVNMIWPATGPTAVDQVMVTDLANQLSFKNVYDMDCTNISGGTTGDQTINKPCGRVNFGATDASLTVTDSLVTTATHVYAQTETNDATCYVKHVVPGSGSFIIIMVAACTAETAVSFHIVN